MNNLQYVLFMTYFAQGRQLIMTMDNRKMKMLEIIMQTAVLPVILNEQEKKVARSFAFLPFFVKTRQMLLIAEMFIPEDN